MAKVKTKDLQDTALDWAVAKCEGLEHLFDGHDVGRHHYSSDWSLAGPITQRERINIHYCRDLRDPNGLYIHAEADAHLHHGYWRGNHDKPLVAAMRCYVAIKMGPEIEIPDEYLESAPAKPTKGLSL